MSHFVQAVGSYPCRARSVCQHSKKKYKTKRKNERERERERDLRLGLKPNFIYNLIRITPSPDPPFKKGCTFAEQNVNVLFI
jgi:hypothetical protein